MLWCRKCNTHVIEPLWATEHTIYGEIDGRQTETFRIPLCPACNRELDHADLCHCGNYKDKDEAWCPECIRIRDENVIHCIAQIRKETKLNLGSEETKDLILSYFE